MTAPSKSTIQSGEIGKKQKTKNMSSINVEEHKCIEIVSDGQSASRNPPFWF